MNAVTTHDSLNFRKLDRVLLGENVQLAAFLNLYGCEIGDNTKIGAFVEIQKGVDIGKNCKISSHTFICTGVTIEDEVFVGHNVTFINDKKPRAAVFEDGEVRLAGPNDWELRPTQVCRGASIGSGATIMAGVRIGNGAVVGAGAVVTKDVPDFATVAGPRAHVLNPAYVAAKKLPHVDLP